MNEIFNHKDLPATRLLSIIRGAGGVSDWNKAAIDNLLERVVGNLKERDVQGNAEVKKTFEQMRDLLLQGDSEKLKEFFALHNSEVEALAKA